MEEESILTFETSGRISIGHIQADVLDATNVKQFGQEVQDYMSGNESVHVLLDFDKVTYLSSAALSELIHLHRLSRKDGGDVRLCDVSSQIMKAFEITNLNKMFVIYQTGCKEALAEFAGSLQAPQG